MSESAYATQLENKLKSYTLSAPAAHWVAKALHPVSGGPSQIPDAIQVDTVVPEYKNTQVLGCPASINTGNWDLLIILPPSDTVGAYWAVGPSGTNFNTATYTPGGTTGVVASGLLQAVPVTPIVGAVNYFAFTGTTAGVPALATRLSGQVSVSQEQPSAWRTTARSATLYASGSDLYNQGTIYAGQYARKVRPSALAQFYNMTGPWSNPQVANVDYVDLPLDETVMALLTPSLYTASSREGVYTVHRLTGPSQEFTHMRLAGQAMAAGASDTYFPSHDLSSYQAAAGHFFTVMNNVNQPSPIFRGNPLVNDQAQQIGTTGFDPNCTWGVIICRGLHPLMTFTIKTVLNVEFTPTDPSPSRQFVRPALKYEPTAMAAYYAIASEAPNCMAAKHNIFGTLLPLLSSVASRVLPFLAPVAGNLLHGLASYIAPKSDEARGGEQPPPRAIIRDDVAMRAPRLRAARSASVSSRASRATNHRVPKRKVKIARRKR